MKNFAMCIVKCSNIDIIVTFKRNGKDRVAIEIFEPVEAFDEMTFKKVDANNNCQNTYNEIYENTKILINMKYNVISYNDMNLVILNFLNM